jgi:hypothetical protein
MEVFFIVFDKDKNEALSLYIYQGCKWFFFNFRECRGCPVAFTLFILESNQSLVIFPFYFGTPISSSSNEEEHETLSLKKTLVQPSKLQRTKKKDKVVSGSSKLVALSGKPNCFIFSSVEMTYINNFSNKNVLCEREVSASGLSDPSLAFIKDILKKIQ